MERSAESQTEVTPAAKPEISEKEQLAKSIKGLLFTTYMFFSTLIGLLLILTLIAKIVAGGDYFLAKRK